MTLEGKQRYRITVYVRSSNSYREFIIEDTLDKAKQIALKTGQIVEVALVTIKNEPLDRDVNWNSKQ